ncbi:MAG: metal ABC transporter permease [Chromatiales bacterium]|nr:metal ABC transporter permease [Chromatiales bacterium]
MLATHVPLGQRVLARGIVFLDLAIAQIAVLGVIAAHALGLAPSGWPTQLAAALRRAERRGAAGTLRAPLAGDSGSADRLAVRGGRQRRRAAAGRRPARRRASVRTAGRADPVGRHRPDRADRGCSMPLLIGVLVAWRGAALGALGFYLMFALAITASVQLVGVYLVFASLILPALAVRDRPLRSGTVRRLDCSGALAYAAGLIASALFDWPAGPAIVDRARPRRPACRQSAAASAPGQPLFRFRLSASKTCHDA